MGAREEGAEGIYENDAMYVYEAGLGWVPSNMATEGLYRRARETETAISV